MSFAFVPQSPPAPMSHIAQQQELMRVYREELRLQQCLQEQCQLMQSLTEAAAGMLSWWREGAAAAAAGATDSDPVAGHPLTSEGPMGSNADTSESLLPSASSLLRLHSGMVFYSLGELLQLWAATAGPSDFGGDGDKDTADNSCALETTSWGERDPSRREAHLFLCTPHRVVECSGEHPPPWTFPASCAVPVPLINDKTGDAVDTPRTPPTILLLPTPAQLIRYRVLDTTCPLPVTHQLLLGSVDADSLGLLLLWLMRLTKECAEALLLCRPDRHVRQVHTPSARIEGQRSSSAVNDGDGRPLQVISTPTAMEHEAVKMIRTKRSRCRDEGDLRCNNGDVVSESWNALCASLIRVFSYVIAAAATASPLEDSERGQSTQQLPPSLMSCMASAATSTALRADLRLFLAEVAEVHDTVLEVEQYCGVADLQCDDSDLALKKPRGESPASAVLPPLAGKGQPMALSNMALLAHLAGIVDAQVRRHL
ncbi:hypothetical protein CUR178_05711 [Leishmania enriettii]|uniref:Uncharacterized protein n=1 Tax=Leishmania enriettii TaxID=5663 RepID=A0A836KP80_LEIEN|nr:hypothetical protein CUR178_05711 [Leishmania enriettii]